MESHSFCIFNRTSARAGWWYPAYKRPQNNRSCRTDICPFGRRLAAMGALLAIRSLMFVSPGHGQISRWSARIGSFSQHGYQHMLRSGSGMVEVLQDDCYAGTCGVWELDSLARDVKESERQALGIEIRRSSVNAIVVVLQGDQLMEIPSRVPLEPTPGMSREEFADLLAQTVAKAVAPFGKWTGVVGCSVTRNVLKALGHPEDSFSEAVEPVLKMAGLRCSFVHSMAPTEAAGYAALNAARASNSTEGNQGMWRQLVLVATLGANWGGVLFNDGHRIRQSGLNTMITPDWAGGASRLPSAGDPAWAEYVRAADNYIADMIELAKPDHVILVPTGAAAIRKERLESSDFIPLLERTAAAAKAQRFTLGGSGSPENAIVRGAGLSALVELRLVRARLEIRKALQGAASVERLSPPQLRAVYDAFSDTASDKLSLAELERGLEALGLTHDASEVFAEGMFSEDVEGKQYMTFKDFCKWWNKCILGARVLSVTSPDALRELVRKKPEEVPGDFGPLIMAEITFSFCRACKSFVRKYEELATKHPDVRFVTFVSNHNRESLKFVSALNVSKAPSFLLYRRGTDIQSPIASWSGSNIQRCESALKEARQSLAMHSF